jgi:hypothetical protein
MRCTFLSNQCWSSPRPADHAMDLPTGRNCSVSGRRPSRGSICWRRTVGMRGVFTTNGRSPIARGQDWTKGRRPSPPVYTPSAGGAAPPQENSSSTLPHRRIDYQRHALAGVIRGHPAPDRGLTCIKSPKSATCQPAQTVVQWPRRPTGFVAHLADMVPHDAGSDSEQPFQRCPFQTLLARAQRERLP